MAGVQKKTSRNAERIEIVPQNRPVREEGQFSRHRLRVDPSSLCTGSGVGSGVGWLFVSLRCGAVSCAVVSEKQAVESGDFRYAAFWCTWLLNRLPGF